MNKCKCGGLMYPDGVHVHVVDNSMVRGCVEKCVRCGEVKVITEVYVKVSARIVERDEAKSGGL